VDTIQFTWGTRLNLRSEVLIDRYVIMQKLGWGHFSTVWLARDFKYGTYVAIKVQKSASHYLDAAYDEVELLQKAAKLSTSDEWRERLKTIHGKDNPRQYTRDDCHVVQLLNAFIYRGPYGHHFCMIFEILGVNLLEIIKRYQYKGVPINLARKIARQCLIGLDYLHTICHIIHTDLKPENVLLTLTQEQINQIVESGEIKRDPRLEDKIAQLQSIFKILPMRTIIEECKGTWGEESPRMASSSAKKSNHSPPKVTPTNSNFIEDTIGSLSTTVDGVFDLKEKFEEIVETHGETLNQRDKKNLKKKLKRKLKKNKKAQGEGEQEESDDEKENHVNAPAPTSSVAQTKKENIKTEAPKKEAPKPKGLLEIIPDPFENDPDPYVREFKLKIADLGNACWTHHHFQPEIQTRQYRSPEVILGIYFNETADIWSFACMNYEMLTGDFLFAPQKNKDYSKSDDHLALMMELLQKFPRNYATIGTNSKKYFDKFGNLKKINDLRHFPLKEALLKT
jgi:serine/threonine-protein kinase SRPK3